MMATHSNFVESSNINKKDQWYRDQQQNETYHRITLHCPQGFNDPFGFGLRVVGQHIGNVYEEKSTPQQNQVSTFARVLWLSPEGVAETTGINVGDRVSFHYFISNSNYNSINICRKTNFQSS